MKKWLVIFGFVYLCVSSSFALSLSELRTQIRRNTRDTSSVSNLQRYSDTAINSFINEAQKDIVNDTWCIQNTSTYTLTAATTYYSLPNDFIGVMQITFNDSSGRTRYLEEKSRKVLSQSNPDFERQSGQPINYFTRYSQTGGNNLEIAYIPVPTTSSTGTVTINYYAQADDLSNDSDVAFNGNLWLVPYHQTIVDLVSFRITSIEGRVNESAQYIQMYGARIKVMKDKFNSLPNYMPSFSAGNPR